MNILLPVTVLLLAIAIIYDGYNTRKFEDKTIKIINEIIEAHNYSVKVNDSQTDILLNYRINDITNSDTIK